jgi:hypothetical protein
MVRRTVMFAALGAMIVFPMLTLPVLAHHGNSSWSDIAVTQKGTVVSYSWRNPHVLVGWSVKDTNGNVAQWIGELASPESEMAEGGMTKDTLKPGDEVIMYLYPAKSGAHNGHILQIKRADGTLVIKRVRGGSIDDAKKADN